MPSNDVHPGLQRQLHRARLEAQLDAERCMNATMDKHGSRMRDSSEVMNALEVMQRQGEVAVSEKLNDVLRGWCGGSRCAAVTTARAYSPQEEEIHTETPQILDQDPHPTPVDVPSQPERRCPPSTVIQNAGTACTTRPTKKRLVVFVEITQRRPRLRKSTQGAQTAKTRAIKTVERSPSIVLLEGPPPPLSPLRARLHRTKIANFPITAPRSLQNIYVTREFFKSNFGGGAITERQVTCGSIPRICHVLFIGVPYTPPSPGEPGLYVHPGPSNSLWPKLMHLMGKMPGTNMSRYFGLYTLVPLGDPQTLQPEEWRGLSQQVRTRWVERLASKRDRNSRTIRARAKLGREATEEEVSEMSDTGIINKMLVPKNLIQDALDEGLVRLHVWGLKCVGYDEEFARLIRTKQREEAVHRVAPVTGKRKRDMST